MHIESIDAFSFAMPEIRDVGDGSQDACLIRVRAGGWTGWGECEAAPLPTIAALVCPMSHSACKPVSASVLGERLESPADIHRIAARVRANSLDLLQADHAFSGVEIALWDLLGRREGTPVWSLLGAREALPKTAYASCLFGDDPGQTYAKSRQARAHGYRAVKFGWGPYGRGAVAADRGQVQAARAGIGPDCLLLVDAGTVWEESVEDAALRLPALAEADATWLEEPFVGGATGAYQALARRAGTVSLAGGEGCHTVHQAAQLLAHGGVGYIQIDTGRIGGIAPARRVALLARTMGATYVNHTFTTQLALSASLQPYADAAGHALCEVPVEPSALALAMTRERLPLRDGLLTMPQGPGLGLSIHTEALRPYLVEAEITVGGRCLYRTPRWE
jgi:L-alanine-DL-glutamate epimerase-like enolase superfamily enzyme